MAGGPYLKNGTGNRNREIFAAIHLGRSKEDTRTRENVLPRYSQAVNSHAGRDYRDRITPSYSRASSWSFSPTRQNLTAAMGTALYTDGARRRAALGDLLGYGATISGS
jgi:hypothetical protein